LPHESKKIGKLNYLYYMLIVKLDKNTNIERALKLLKSKVIKTRQTSQLVERKEYEKKSVKKRKMIKKAKYVQKLRDKEN